MVLLRPCATSAGFSAVPEPPRRLDMGQVRDGLRRDGFTILVDAKVILVVRGLDPAVESSIYSDAKVILKTTDQELAKAAYDQLAKHIA